MQFARWGESHQEAATGAPAIIAPISPELLLVEEGLVTEEQVERARRIASRMRRPRPSWEVLVDLGLLARSEMERVVRAYRTHLSVVDILHEDGVLDESGLRKYNEARTHRPPPSDREILVGGELVSEQQYLHALAEKLDIPYLEPEIAPLDEQVLDRVSIPYLVRKRLLPVRVADGALTVIMQDPLDSEALAEMRRIYKVPIQTACAPGDAIAAALNRLQNRNSDAGESEEVTALKYREIRELEEGEEIGIEAVRIVDHVLYRAIQMRASDVHIEPLQRKLVVRVRVDGVLQLLTELPADLAPRIAARVKVLCNADLAERRLHQDGRIFAMVDAKEVDMRVSIYVSMFGETMVVRILDRQRGLIPLEALGFEPSVLSLLREVVLRSSSGLTLMTGPTGSGKTTTLYSFIDSMLDGASKIITCEDPVEYVLEGTTQCSLNAKAGQTFADSIRAMVRQDPDIIVIGEVRDPETAHYAVEAALTGHKVLSTFHTEDTVGAVVRLLEMGIEPFLVASTMGAIVGQRLIRKLCPHCSRHGTPSKRDLRYLSLSRDSLGGMPVPERVGCGHCGGTGYKGRCGIYEVLVPDDDFRDAILRRAPSRELRAHARQLTPFLTLQEDGLLKVMAGITTLSELADCVPRDVDARPLTLLREIATRKSLQ